MSSGLSVCWVGYVGYQIHVPCIVLVESDGLADIQKHKDRSST